MKYSKYVIIAFCIYSAFFYSCSEREIPADQLQKRGDLYHAVNEEDPYSGKVTENYSNGQKKSVKHYIDGMLDGLLTAWTQNGQKLEESMYQDGLLDGLSTKWRDNGYKDVEINYREGKRNGVSVEYSGGYKRLESTYKDDQLDGLYTYWYDEEQKAIEKKYKNGVLNGSYISYYKSGNKKLEKTYTNGKINGLSVKWLEDGKKIREKNYSEGKGISPWAYYNPDGKKFNLYFVDNDFELTIENSDLYKDIVSDKTTGLMWDRFRTGITRKKTTYESAKRKVDRLNEIKFGGYNDWRLPTLEEAFTLLEPTKLKKGEKYFDDIFYKPTKHGNYTSPFVIWTVNKYLNKRWVFFYVDGAYNLDEDEPGMYLKNRNEKFFVKVVRTMEK